MQGKTRVDNLRHNKEPIRAFKKLFNDYKGLFICGERSSRLARRVSFTAPASLVPILFIKFLLCSYEKAGWPICQDPRWTSQDLSKRVVFFNEWKKLAGRNKWKRRPDKGAVDG